MLYRWFDRTGNIEQAAWKTFMITGYGKTASSPLQAETLAMFRPDIDEYVMNRDRLLDTAVKCALDLATGYRPRRHEPLQMAGRGLWQEMLDWLKETHEKGQLTPHDVTTATQLASIVTGGDIDARTTMSENEICDLERESFLTLAKTDATRARILHMLEHGAPLRN